MWLYLPPLSLSVQVSGVSIEDSTVHSPPPELWVTSSGKPTPRPLLWNGWEKRKWIKLLSGVTCSPSTASRGAAAWIQSLPELPVRISRSPVSALAFTASDPDSSSKRSESHANQAQTSSSGKTSPGLSENSPPSSPPSKKLVTGATHFGFQFHRWEEATSDEEFSSLLTHLRSLSSGDLWPTATAQRAGNNRGGAAGRQDQRIRDSLESQAKKWPTIMGSDGAKGPTKFAGGNPSLPGAVKTWPTTTTMDARASGGRDPTKCHAGTSLTDAAVRQWPPRVSPTWPTPAARDFKGANSAEHLAKERGHHDQLPNAVAMFDQQAFLISRLRDLMSSSDGSGSSKFDPTSRRLNPRFVEWLMGWPQDSTAIR